MSKRIQPPPVTPELVETDYRILLRDGIVIWHSDFRTGWGNLAKSWSSALEGLAAADGLRCGLAWYRCDDVAFHPCVEMLRPDGTYHPSQNVWPPPSQDTAALEMRPLVEADWGETLERARRRAGLTSGAG